MQIIIMIIINNHNNVFCKRVHLKSTDNKRNYIVNLTDNRARAYRWIKQLSHELWWPSNKFVPHCRCWTIRWIYLKACWCKTLIKILNLTLFSANIGIPKDSLDTSWNLSYKIRSFFVGNKYNMSDGLYSCREKGKVSFPLQQNPNWFLHIG